MTFSLTTFLASILVSVLISYLLIGLAFFHAVNASENILTIIKKLNNKNIKSRKLLAKEYPQQVKSDKSYLIWAWTAFKGIEARSEKNVTPKDAKE